MTLYIRRNGQEFIYDQRDRLVYSQDGNHANTEWMVNFHDVLDRVTLTGVYKTTKTRAQLQSDLNNGGATSSLIISSGSTPANLIISERTVANAPVRYLASESIDFVPNFASLPNDEFVAEIGAAGNGESRTIILTAAAAPAVNTNDPAIFTDLAYHYYDDYNFTGVKAFENTFSNSQAYSYAEPDIEFFGKTSRTRGMLTGSKTRVLNTSTFLFSTAYYDEEANVLQVLEDNYKQGTDLVTNQYHFDGRLMSTNTRHGLPGGEFNGFNILTKNEYDKIGRLKAIWKKYGGADFVKISDHQFDELDNLKTKKIGKKPGTAGDPLETLNYSYNATGILTGINKDYALSANTGDQWNNYFGAYLGYENDNRFIGARWDGLLTGTIWKTQGDNSARKYDYSYDAAGRFTAALFTEKASPADANWSNANKDFSESDMEYDETGNLRKLYRKGIVVGNNAPVYIDKLTYTYKQNGQWSNQLLKVFDDNPSIGATANGKLGDFKDEVFNTDANDYTYDANGNLVIDNNKKIRNGSGNGIIYNYLNKAEKIILENKSTVEFVYDAAGKRLAKKITPSSSGPIRTTVYIGEYVYENDVLQFILHEEGRLRVMNNVNSQSNLGASGLTVTGNVALPSGKHGVFEYFIKDQLGSTRMVLTEEYHKEMFKCTMEDAASAEENSIFGKVDNNGNPAGGNEVIATRENKLGWSSNASAKVSRLFTTSSSGTKSVGPNVLLKVMAGDKIAAYADYYYNVQTSNVANTHILNTIVSSLIGGFSGGDVGQAVKDGTAAVQTMLQDPAASPLLTYLGNRPSQAPNSPKAYLNYIFFDEHFKYVNEVSGAKLVRSDLNDYYLVTSDLRAPKNGYAYVYLSNESDLPVQFDNFTVSHERGAIIEESHYYPHGLKIAGISAKAYGKLANKYGFQGAYTENEEESGYDEFALRTYDAQIGRWLQADPYDGFASGYVGMGNDPVNNVDPSGGSIEYPFAWTAGQFWSTLGGSVAGALAGSAIAKNNGGSGNTGAMIGAAIGGTLGFGAGGLDLSGFADFFGDLNVNFNPIISKIFVHVAIQTTNYWLYYNGGDVMLYMGNYGDITKSKATKTYPGTAGAKLYQLPKYQSVKDKGPIPEGDYTIDLKPSFTRKASSNSTDGLTAPGVGVELLPWGNGFLYDGWGQWRARLQAVKGTNLYKRDGNFYFHDSYKGYSHGCIETSTDLYYDLHDLQKKGIKVIQVKVKYTTPTTIGATWKSSPPWKYKDHIGRDGIKHPAPKPGAFPDLKRM